MAKRYFHFVPVEKRFTWRVDKPTAMGFKQAIYLLLFIYGTFVKLCFSDKKVMESTVLMPSTTSGKTSSVLREILNQESLVRFSMVQRIQKLVMDVIENKDSTQNVKERLSEVMEDLQMLEKREQDLQIENSNLSLKLNAMNEAMKINRNLSMEETKNIDMLRSELMSKSDDSDTRFELLEGSLRSFSIAVNKTLRDIRENQEASSIQLLNISSLIRAAASPVDCLDILDQGRRITGIYKIYPWKSSTYKEVLCDMETMGGGWTVFQRRYDGSVSFSRNWMEYQRGFGNASTEYWLGNDALHALTVNSSSLYVKLQRTNGSRYFQYYSDFRISGASDDYRIQRGSYYNGTAGNRMPNNNTFKTPDHSPSRSLFCFRDFTEGGWWFDRCHTAYLNGVYGSRKWINPWYGLISSGTDFRSSLMMTRRQK